MPKNDKDVIIPQSVQVEPNPVHSDPTPSDSASKDAQATSLPATATSNPAVPIVQDLMPSHKQEAAQGEIQVATYRAKETLLHCYAHIHETAGTFSKKYPFSKVQYLFIFVVLFPTVLVFLYYALMASPMYISQTKFAIQNANNQTGSLDVASLLFGSVTSTSSDNYIILEYLQSPAIIEDINRELDLRKHYTSDAYDIFSRLSADPTQNEWLSYWGWAVKPVLDSDAGIIVLEVKAFTADMSKAISSAILARSEALINTMNHRAQKDSVYLAQQEVDLAEKRVKKAQASMRTFRETHATLDLLVTASGMQTRIMQLEGDYVRLQTQLTEALSFMQADAPAVRTLQISLAAVKKQLDGEKQRMAGTASNKNALSSTVGEYEDLALEATFAQEQLLMSMTALESARIQQAAKSRYLVAFQQPTLPDESLYPKVFLFTFYVFCGSLVGLGLISLIVAAVREHAGF